MCSKRIIFTAVLIGILLSIEPCQSANLTGSSLVTTDPSCNSATLADYYACTKRASATAMAGNSFNMTTDQRQNGLRKNGTEPNWLAPKRRCYGVGAKEWAPKRRRRTVLDNDCKVPIVKSKTRSITLDDTCDSKALDAKSSVFATCLQKKNFSVPVVGSLKKQLFEISGFTKSNITNQVKPFCSSEKSQKATGDCLDQLFLKNGYAQQTKSNRLMKQNYCKLQNQCSSNLSTACKAYLQSVKSAVCACSIQTDYGERKFVNDCLGKKTNNIARNVFGSVYCDFMKACPNSLKKLEILLGFMAKDQLIRSKNLLFYVTPSSADSPENITQYLFSSFIIYELFKKFLA
uniref:Uncharacterized protein n=1 Tax=Romanomermis culicivorax TaxID=13658 RepID=A0A915IDD0_ROMCU